MSVLPESKEYHSYFSQYIDLVPEAAAADALIASARKLKAALVNLSEDRADHSYSTGKWSIKEIVGHLIDTERVFAYRALRIARGDTTAMPAFDQDLWAANARWSERTLADILKEYETVRTSTVMLFEHLTPEELMRMGIASGHSISVRALGYALAGHDLHHLKVIKERYL